MLDDSSPEYWFTIYQDLRYPTSEYLDQSDLLCAKEAFEKVRTELTAYLNHA